MDNKQLIMYIIILLLNVSAFNENFFEKVCVSEKSVKHF